MGVFAVVVLAAGLVAGVRWKHARTTWSDHQAVRAKERALKELRWSAVRSAVVGSAIAVFVLYLALSEPGPH